MKHIGFCVDSMANDGWYVLKTKPRQEDRAGFARQGFNSFGPKLAVERIAREAYCSHRTHVSWVHFGTI